MMVESDVFRGHRSVLTRGRRLRASTKIYISVPQRLHRAAGVAWDFGWMEAGEAGCSSFNVLTRAWYAYSGVKDVVLSKERVGASGIVVVHDREEGER